MPRKVASSTPQLSAQSRLVASSGIARSVSITCGQSVAYTMRSARASMSAWANGVMSSNGGPASVLR